MPAVEGRFRAAQRFICHDRNSRSHREARHTFSIGQRNRLLDEITTNIFQRRNGVGRHRFAPCLIDIDTHAGSIAQSPLDGCHMGNIVFGIAFADFQLEDIVATLGQHGLGFRYVA